MQREPNQGTLRSSLDFLFTYVAISFCFILFLRLHRQGISDGGISRHQYYFVVVVLHLSQLQVFGQHFTHWFTLGTQFRFQQGDSFYSLHPRGVFGPQKLIHLGYHISQGFTYLLKNPAFQCYASMFSPILSYSDLLLCSNIFNLFRPVGVASVSAPIQMN